MKPVTPISMMCFPDKALAYRERISVSLVIKVNDGAFGRRGHSNRGGDGALQALHVSKVKIFHQALTVALAIGAGGQYPGKKSPGPDDRRQQAPGGDAIAKFQTVGDDPLDAQMLGQWAGDVIKPLADQNYPGARLHQCRKLANAILFQVWLHLVFEIFFAQEIKAVTADAA